MREGIQRRTEGLVPEPRAGRSSATTIVFLFYLTFQSGKSSTSYVSSPLLMVAIQCCVVTIMH